MSSFWARWTGARATPAAAAVAEPSSVAADPAPAVVADAPSSPVVPKAKTNRLSLGGHIAALAIATIGGFEGLRETAYPDPASKGDPWTICYGHTGHVLPGEQESLAECKRLLLADLDKEASGIEGCIHVPMSDARYVAVLSLAHNIGVAGVCKSSVVRDLNAGRDKTACDDFLKYDRAAGVVFPGLARRRRVESALCLE